MLKPSSTRDELLDAISSLRWGVEGRKHDLKVEFLAHLAQLDRNSNCILSRQAIEKWFQGSDTERIRGKSKTFLYNYLTSRIHETSDNKELYGNVITFLTSHPAVMNSNYPGAREALLTYLIAISDLLPPSHLDDFFYTSPSGRGDPLDQSYYVTYRYSTLGEGIIKTFLVCRKPRQGESSQFMFTEFFNSGEGFSPDVHRESNGIILRLEKSYYFLGSSYVIPLEKWSEDISIYQMARMESRKKPIGIELISAERDEIILERGLFPAIITTIAGERQPIMSRLAVLHLGTRQSLGDFLRDELVSPTELASEALAEDLHEMVGRMRARGLRRFGRVLQAETRKPSWDGSRGRELAEQILSMIENSPAGGAASVHAKGAIETYSRTDNRPRL